MIRIINKIRKNILLLYSMRNNVANKKRKLLGEIISLSDAINESDKYTVFVTYYGHTKGLEVEVIKGKWRPGRQLSELHRVYLDKDNSINELKKIRLFLSKLYKEVL